MNFKVTCVSLLVSVSLSASFSAASTRERTSTDEVKCFVSSVTFGMKDVSQLFKHLWGCFSTKHQQQVLIHLYVQQNKYKLWLVPASTRLVLTTYQLTKHWMLIFILEVSNPVTSKNLGKTVRTSAVLCGLGTRSWQRWNVSILNKEWYSLPTDIKLQCHCSSCRSPALWSLLFRAWCWGWTNRLLILCSFSWSSAARLAS